MTWTLASRLTLQWPAHSLEYPTKTTTYTVQTSTPNGETHALC